MKWTDWLAGSGICSVDLRRWIDGRETIVLKLTLRGEYGPLHQDEASRVLRMAISAAFAWGHLPPTGLILDLKDLVYWGGDTLLSWDHLLDDSVKLGFRHTRVAFMCSPDNAAHIQSLLDEAGDDTRMRSFLTEDEAIEYVLPSQ